MGKVGAVLAVSAFVTFFAAPASAGCVSCGTDGESCIIKTRSSSVICTPSGVCDPNQANTCGEEDNPWVNASPGEEISAKFLSRIDPIDPLLAAALSGAITDEISRTGLVVKRYLLSGEHTGTIGRNGASYRFTVHATQIAQNAFSVAVAIEEEGTSRVDKFEGVILEKGRAGSLDRIGEKGRSRVVAWNGRDGETATRRSN